MTVKLCKLEVNEEGLGEGGKKFLAARGLATGRSQDPSHPLQNLGEERHCPQSRSKLDAISSNKLVSMSAYFIFFILIILLIVILCLQSLSF